MEKDIQPRVAAVPEDFAEALRNADLRDAFSRMS
jgi:hypothetical protein